MTVRSLLSFFLICSAYLASAQNYHMPGEHLPHEGTWLQWPHNDLYGPFYQDDVTSTFVGMASALQTGERVHIIAKDQTHQNQIETALTNASVPLNNITFYQYPTDDVWIRDNGPIFVFDTNNVLHILDWGFNGWGNDAPFNLCDQIPGLVSNDIQVPWIDLQAMVLEGGAIEHDGHYVHSLDSRFNLGLKNLKTNQKSIKKLKRKLENSQKEIKIINPKPRTRKQNTRIKTPTPTFQTLNPET